jgi:hypothetical protein
VRAEGKDGKDGLNGVYIGEGEMPEGYRLQFEFEEGEPLVFDPDPVTEDMTVPVGINPNGKLFAMATATGSSGDFRYIRKVTIPEDITTDTSGVNFAYATANTPENGVLFGFDTDENGEPFALQELYIVAYAATNHTERSFNLNIDALPQYAANAQLGTNMTIGTKGAKIYSLSYSILFPNKGSLSWMAFCGGGAFNNWQTSAKLNNNAHFTNSKKIDAIGAYMHNYNGYGFSAGSTFEFYGR